MPRVAISVANDRIAPVFDVSRRLLIVDIDNDGRQISQTEHVLDEVTEFRQSGRLSDLDVDVLICGAVSRCMAERVEANGIQIIPWIGGYVGEVFNAYLTGQLSDPRFILPGCNRQRRGRRYRCGARRVRHDRKTIKGDMAP